MSWVVLQYVTFGQLNGFVDSILMTWLSARARIHMHTQNEDKVDSFVKDLFEINGKLADWMASTALRQLL